MQPAEIARRAEAIRLGNKELGRRAGKHEKTVGRILAEQLDPLTSTVNAIADAVIDEERRQLLRLAALHPDLVAVKPQPKQTQAAE